MQSAAERQRRSHGLNALFAASLPASPPWSPTAAGPVTAIFFLSENLPVIRFLGTTAWFYLIVNLIKLPISIHLGMITWAGFLSMAWTIPLIIITVMIGRAIASHVSQEVFTKLIYVLSVFAVIKLLI